MQLAQEILPRSLDLQKAWASIENRNAPGLNPFQLVGALCQSNIDGEMNTVHVSVSHVDTVERSPANLSSWPS